MKTQPLLLYSNRPCEFHRNLIIPHALLSLVGVGGLGAFNTFFDAPGLVPDFVFPAAVYSGIIFLGSAALHLYAYRRIPKLEDSAS